MPSGVGAAVVVHQLCGPDAAPEIGEPGIARRRGAGSRGGRHNDTHERHHEQREERAGPSSRRSPRLQPLPRSRPAAVASDSAAGDSTAAETSVAAAVEQALYEKGDTQELSCESLGTVEVAGVSREVARCSFSEEKDGAGEMRARGGCFVLEDGAALDVTMDVPADVTCFTKT